MALTNEIKDGLAFLRDIQSKAKDKKDDLEKIAAQLESIASAFKSLAKGDSSKLNVTLTQWQDVNRLLAAKASAENELTKSASPDWNKIGDGVAGVVGVAVKIALALVSI